VSKNIALETLYCFRNKLTMLDVSGATALRDLDCHENHLTKLDLSMNTALRTLDVRENCFNSKNDIIGFNIATSLFNPQRILVTFNSQGGSVVNYEVCSPQSFFTTLHLVVQVTFLMVGIVIQYVLSVR